MDYHFCEVVLILPTSATRMFWNGFVEKAGPKTLVQIIENFVVKKLSLRIVSKIHKHETQLLWIQPINMLPGSFQSKSLIKAEKHQAHDIHWDGWFLFFTVANQHEFTVLGGVQSSNPRFCCVRKNSFNFVGEFLALRSFWKCFWEQKNWFSKKMALV